MADSRKSKKRGKKKVSKKEARRQEKIDLEERKGRTKTVVKYTKVVAESRLLSSDQRELLSIGLLAAQYLLQKRGGMKPEAPKFLPLFLELDDFFKARGIKRHYDVYLDALRFLDRSESVRLIAIGDAGRSEVPMEDDNRFGLFVSAGTHKRVSLTRYLGAPWLLQMAKVVRKNVRPEDPVTIEGSQQDWDYVRDLAESYMPVVPFEGPSGAEMYRAGDRHEGPLMHSWYRSRVAVKRIEAETVQEPAKEDAA